MNIYLCFRAPAALTMDPFAFLHIRRDWSYIIQSIFEIFHSGQSFNSAKPWKFSRNSFIASSSEYYVLYAVQVYVTSKRHVIDDWTQKMKFTLQFKCEVHIIAWEGLLLNEYRLRQQINSGKKTHKQLQNHKRFRRIYKENQRKQWKKWQTR